MYEVHVLDMENNIIAELKSKSKTIAHDFMYDQICDSWYRADTKVGLYDPGYGYYAMAIPHYENNLAEAFEIIRLSSDKANEFVCIPTANDIMYEELKDCE